MKPYKVIGYTECPFCDNWSLGVQANGRIVRHSVGFGSVEKVGPGTRHPRLRTTICKGSGYLIPKKELVMLLANKDPKTPE